MPLDFDSRAERHTRLRVLLVDDDTTVRGLLRLYLQKRGHEVLAVATKAEATEALARMQFDVVVADVLLPDGDGLDLLNDIQTKQLARRVVTVTGGGRYFGPEFFGRVAHALGAVVLRKPFDRETFLAAVEGRTIPTPVTTPNSTRAV